MFIIFFKPTEVKFSVSLLQHQQQVAAAVERAKQVTMTELNAIIGVNFQLLFKCLGIIKLYKKINFNLCFLLIDGSSGLWNGKRFLCAVINIALQQMKATNSFPVW